MKDVAHIPIYISRGECISPLGFDISQNYQSILEKRTAISYHEDKSLYKEKFIGGLIPKDELEEIFKSLKYTEEYSTLEKMMLVAADKIKQKYQDYFSQDCGLVISSTKGNIDSLQENNVSQYYLHLLGQKISNALGINEEAIILSNACVSGAQAISVAKRFIQLGRYKHCLVIGGDLFSNFVYSGFQSFQAVSTQPCKPYDANRDGISLGEAAAAVFLSKEKNVFKEDYYEVIGDSSINDANHISGPSRTGEGLFLSISNTLTMAKITSEEIDFVSSHGTATLYNDEMEAQAFTRANLQNKPVFSLKGYFGHTLGAAGLIETIISMEFARNNLVPLSLGYEEHGVTLPLSITKEIQSRKVQIFLKTASGFGGSNTALILKKIHN